MNSVKTINKKKLSSEIKNLKKDFSTNEVINSFIQLYLFHNNIFSEKIKELNECSNYLRYDNNILLNQISKQYNFISIKDLEAVFESLIDFDRKKAEGAVYTPDYIIDYILNYSLENYKGINIPVICDPACGSGGFLVRAIKILSDKYSISIEESVNFIKGIDINEQSISCAKIIIELYYLSKGIIIKSLDNNIVCGDTLLNDKTVLLEKLNIKNGIDVLVTNPPYVKLQNIDSNYRKELINKYPNFTNGSFSFSMLFLVAGKNLLSKNGILGYITQNNFFTSLSSKNIREFLQNTKCIHTIIDFLHTKIFENASAYTCLMFLVNNLEINEFNFMWSLNPIKDLEKSDFSKININKLNSNKWRLAPQNHLENIHKIENIGKQLGHIGDIKVGFATLKDTVFLLDKNNSLNLESSILKSAIKISELDDENSISEKMRKIIFPYKKINNKYMPYEEEELKNLFPNTYKYLLDNLELLQTRSEGKKSLDNFYEWGRTQGMEAPSYKLLTKTFSGRPNFMLDKTDSLFCNGYSVKPKIKKNGEEVIDILILQKILNSSIMNYYSKITSFQLDGNYQCFQKNFIELFNIPNLTDIDNEFIKNNSGEELDRYLASLYDINFQDIQDILNR
ncbi:HsdM family class I SAM-dependent methyltransferase [Aliarcobacter butzleri]|uniref:HsdM family class I SAM-dependent methyltransferase n=1 Tax=Aliarcobacter butzleri TaxID=28197 RepID=UPI002B248718|nr:N-6 DNA methylase [Aliarcobacter butzleri]